VPTPQGRDLAALRELNTRAVLAALYAAAQPQTISELSALTTVSRPTIQATIDALLHDGLARESDAPLAATRMGRPARTFELNARREVVIGLDVGPHGIVGLLADLRGTVLGEQRQSRDLRDATAAFEAVTGIVDQLLSTARLGENDLTAVSVGVPGIVNADGDLGLTTVVPDWPRSNLGGRLRDRYATATVYFDNDTKLAALAEHQLGCARGLDDFVFLLLSDRIAAAAFVKGELVRGANGAAGEIGALSGFSWPEAYGQYQSEALTAGADRLAAQAASIRFASEISQGLAALCLAFDPAAVVIAGEPFQSDDEFIRTLQNALAETALFPPPLLASTLQSLAVPRGAIGRATEEIRLRLLS
jgi:predicted NBD/HSP70 family sugar kinase